MIHSKGPYSLPIRFPTKYVGSEKRDQGVSALMGEDNTSVIGIKRFQKLII